jgi:hypothetical protein
VGWSDSPPCCPQDAASPRELQILVQDGRGGLPGASAFLASRPCSGLDSLVRPQPWAAGNQICGCFASIAQHRCRRPEQTSAVLASPAPPPPFSGKSPLIASWGTPPMCAVRSGLSVQMPRPSLPRNGPIALARSPALLPLSSVPKVVTENPTFWLYLP